MENIREAIEEVAGELESGEKLSRIDVLTCDAVEALRQFVRLVVNYERAGLEREFIDRLLVELMKSYLEDRELQEKANNSQSATNIGGRPAGSKAGRGTAAYENGWAALETVCHMDVFMEANGPPDSIEELRAVAAAFVLKSGRWPKANLERVIRLAQEEQKHFSEVKAMMPGFARKILRPIYMSQKTTS